MPGPEKKEMDPNEAESFEDAEDEQDEEASIATPPSFLPPIEGMEEQDATPVCSVEGDSGNSPQVILDEADGSLIRAPTPPPKEPPPKKTKKRKSSKKEVEGGEKKPKRIKRKKPKKGAAADTSLEESALLETSAVYQPKKETDAVDTSLDDTSLLETSASLVQGDVTDEGDSFNNALVIVQENDGDKPETPAKEKKKKTKRERKPKETKKETVTKELKTSDEVCESLNLNKPDYDYRDDDYQNLTSYKIFSQHIRPMIVDVNPKITMSKAVSLVGALWREFMEHNPYRKPKSRRSKAPKEVVVEEPILEPVAEADESMEVTEDDEAAPAGSSKRQRNRSTKKVAPIKIKIQKKSKRKKRNSSDEDEGFNTSDEEFERQLEEAALVEEQEKIEKAEEKARKPKVKQGRGRKSKKKKRPKNADPDAEGYETDHQDYCEVCQQGGEIILCDTCPRAYHLVCLDPELEEPPEGKWSCPHCEENGPPEKEEDDEHMEFCRVCKDGGELLCCDVCPSAYHTFCLNPPVSELPNGHWHCPRCSCVPLQGRVHKILTWRWKVPPKVDDELDHVTPHTAETKKKLQTEHKEREFFVRWHDMSYWHCEWISELQLDVYHPAMLRNYMRKYDMDEPPPLEDGSSYGKDNDKIKELDIHNLEERFYRYGVRPEWLQVHRIMNHRVARDGTVWYLVKWRELPYDQSTWESETQNDSDIIQLPKAIDDYYEMRYIVLGVDDRVKSKKVKSKKGKVKKGKKKKVPTATLR